ncbi:hypothetical protein VTO73DRAFT_1654 [Trametes versicolor]
MSFSLTVTVNSADIAPLKAAGYKLCLAKKVNGTFNVIWQGGNFLYRNTFTWSSKYQVFGADDYANGALVQASTEVVAIQFGQTATLDANGSMHPAGGTPNSSGTFRVSNQYGAINIGVNGFLNGVYAPIYVSPTPFVSGPVDLTPEEEVLVWFDTTHVTGMMIAESISNSINIDFTQVASRSVTYASVAGKGAWSLDGQLALSRTYDVRTNRFTIDKPTPALLSKMVSILAAPQDSDSEPPQARVKATAWFGPGGAGEFADYLRDARPDWDIISAGEATEVRLIPADDGPNVEEAIRTCEAAFLEAYRGFQGEPYTKLAFEVINQQEDEPTFNVATAADVSTGRAVFRFSNIPNAQSFATKTAASSGAGVTLGGALKGVAVIVTASFDNPTANPVADRAKVKASLDQRVAVWNGEDASHSLIYAGPIIWKGNL